MNQTKSHGKKKKKSHGQRRKVGEKQFSILQVHAQIINPGELNNQKKQVYILHIILIPKQKKKYQLTHQKNITHQQLGEIHWVIFSSMIAKGCFLFFSDLLQE